MPQVANASDFPVPNDFTQPIGMLACWSVSHRNPSRVTRDAVALISQLEFIATLRMDVAFALHADMEGAAGTQAQHDEEMLELLQSMRAMHAELGGVRVQRIRRDVERLAPHLKGRLQKSVDAASASIAHMRAILAFMTGENDDADLDIEIVPNAGAPLPPEDSSAPV